MMMLKLQLHVAPYHLLVTSNLRCLSHDDSQAQSDALPPIEALALARLHVAPSAGCPSNVLVGA